METLGECGVVFPRQRRRQDLTVHAESDVAAGDLLQLGRQRIVQQKPRAHGPEHRRHRLIEPDGDGDDLQDALRLRQQAETLEAGERIADGGLVRGDFAGTRRSAGGIQHFTPLVRQQEQARTELPLIADRHVRNRRRIVGINRRLELRQIGDETRHQHEQLRAIGAELIDLGARRDDFPFERPLGLFGHAHAHEVDRHADAEDRQQGARQEHPAPQRREHFHRTAKSCSALPPSGTVTVFGSLDVPSFQAITLYVPGGTFSIR